MFLNNIEKSLPMIIFVAAVMLISFLITKPLYRRKKLLIFLMPGIFAIISVIFWILAFTSQGWDALGYYLYAMIALLAALGASVASLIVWIMQRIKNKKLQE